MKLSSVKPFFPQAFKAHDVKSLVIALLIYAVVACVLGWVLGLLSFIPIVGFITNVIGWLVKLYCVAGIILALLVFLNVVK